MQLGRWAVVIVAVAGTACGGTAGMRAEAEPGAETGAEPETGAGTEPETETETGTGSGSGTGTEAGSGTGTGSGSGGGRVPVSTSGSVTALSVSTEYACVIADGHPVCVGEVPTLTGTADVATHPELEADLLVTLPGVRCFGLRGARELRCFGQDAVQMPTREEETLWEAECDGDPDCFDERMSAFDAAQADGVVLAAPGPLRDLASTGSAVCALADGGRIRCWDTGEAMEHVFRELTVARATRLAGGEGSLCALRDDGAVLCWEEWLDPDERPRPRPVAGVRGATRLAVGDVLSCAWDADGRASCWGLDWLYDHELPETGAARVPELDGADALALREELGCVLRAGALECHGDARFGQLGRPPRDGDGRVTFGHLNPPGRPAIEGARLVGVGQHHACAVDGAGALHCWGRGDHGALGPAHRRRDFAPVEVRGVRASAITAFDHRSCARTDGGWRCWGRASSADRRPEPWVPEPTSTAPDAVPLMIGIDACQLRADRLRCERRGAATLDVRVREVVRDGQAACWITSAGAVECQLRATEPPRAVDGIGDAAVLGSSSMLLAVCERSGRLHLLRQRFDGVTPIRVLDAGPGVTHVAVTWGRVCVRDGSGAVRCARLEEGELAPFDLPPVRAIDSGSRHVCALANDGRVLCWGSGGDGELGSDQSSETPVAVPGVSGARSIAISRNHSCALLEDARVLCWGHDAEGQLGARPDWWHLEPVQLTAPRN